jgi:3-hydroxy-9,10-secoandrosta-1,3,5(10)-triene-9,17-dione monooxygenase
MASQSQDETLTREAAVRRAQALAPALRARAEACERQRRVPDETVADLIASRILRLCQPARFGGSGLGWDALCEASIALARGDGSQAWVANVYMEHECLLALFGDQAQHDVWDADRDALIAATIIPAGNTVRRAAGGYVLDGRWGFASGIDHASWVILGEMAGEEHLFFLLPKGDYTVIDDWHTLGLAGTGSRTVAVRESFVPEHRAISNRLVAAGQAPGAAIDDNPLYRMPFLGFAQLALTSVPLGVALGMVDDFAQQLRNPSESMFQRMAESAAEMRAAELLLMDTVRSNMAALAEKRALGEADAARSLRDSAYVATLAKRTAARLFEATGGRGIYLTQPLQRAFRDVHAAAVHGSLNWDRNMIRYGRSMTTRQGDA